MENNKIYLPRIPVVIVINNKALYIWELSHEEAIEYSELMKQTFIEHWQKEIDKKMKS